MSWAEIKKAVNSNIDVPLDKYLDGNKQTMLQVNGNIANQVGVNLSPTTICNITGKGFLYTSLIKMKLADPSANYAGYSKFKTVVTIDGIVRNNVEVNGKTGTSKSDYIVWRTGLRDTSLIPSAYNPTDTGIVWCVEDNNNFIALARTGTFTLYVPSSMGGTIWDMTNEPLYFENGFSVVVSGTAKSGRGTDTVDYSILYSLLD